MRRNRADPVSHQLIRGLSGLLFIVPPLLFIAGYGWWAIRQPGMIPEWTNWVVLVIALIFMAPFVGFYVFLLARFSPPLGRTYGPIIPYCKKCGYDCRVSPYRCPECGSRSVKRT